MSEMIDGMQEDKTGCLWMSTNRGLGKYYAGFAYDYFELDR